MYANDAGDLAFLDNPRYARYWVDYGGSSSRYAVFEPLSRTERLSQFASSNRWRTAATNWVGDLGRFAAALPIFTEAIKDTVKVGTDLYKRKRDPNPDDYDLVLPKKMVNNTSQTTRMYAPGYERPGASHNTNHGGHLHYSKRVGYKGRRKSTRSMLYKLAKQSVVTYIDRFLGVNPFSGDQGYFKLWNHVNTTGGVNAQVQTMPWHLFDLTASPVSSDPTAFAMNCQFHEGPNEFRWVPFRGSNDLGVNYQEYSPYPEFNSDQGGGFNGTAEKHILEWVDLRFMFYGQSNNATRWTIEIIQFVYEEDAPGGILPTVVSQNSATPAVVSKNVGGEYCTKAIDHLRPYVFSPIMPSVPNERQPFVKVLKRYEFWQQPKNTTVGDTDSPPITEYRLFYRPNRLCNYAWVPKDEAFEISAAPRIDDDAKGLSNHVSVAYPYVTPRARVFLSIRSNSGRQTGSTTVTAETARAASSLATSYDFVCRRKWVDTL